MGKRSINSTKSGKFMNPTDQARKEARRRELKKNKKQRQLVRTAVIKGKNPTEIILELEKLDDMEYNVLCPPPLNDKVMKEKRRKLMETWHRVIVLYEKEGIEQHIDLKKLWHNYLNRRDEVIAHFDAVKYAQAVDVNEIPLPSLPDGDGGNAGDIPLPLPPKVGILKKSSVLDTLRPKTCPGVPAGPPPSLVDYDDDDESEAEKSEPKSKKIRFEDQDEAEGDVEAPGEEKGGPKVDSLQRKMLAMSGQDVDAYMKEMEEVHKKTEAEKAADLQERMSKLEKNQPQPPGESFMPQPPGPPSGVPPFMMPMRPGIPPPGVRLPPGPPPGRPQLPPGPPPGRPPFMQRGGPMHGGPPRMPSIRPLRPPQQSVVSAGPQLTASSSGPMGAASGSGSATASTSKKTGSVIEAKPQMRNLMSDVTRFVPTNVKVKRDGQAAGKKKQSDPMRDVFAKHAQPPQQPQPNKDDAYAQFMKEMNMM